MGLHLAFIDSKPGSFYLVFAAIFLSEIILASEVSDIRTWRAPDHTRVVFDLTGPIKHTLLILENPDRVVVDLKNTQLEADIQSLKLNKTPIKKIRSGKQRNGDLRIVLDLNQKDLDEFNNICEECKKEHESVSQNLILTGFKLCKSCRWAAPTKLIAHKGCRM